MPFPPKKTNALSVVKLTQKTHDIYRDTMMFNQNIPKNAFPPQKKTNALSVVKLTHKTHDIYRDTMMVVWNARSAVPVRTFFEAHPGGIVSIDITPDALYIATIGAGPNQDLSVWEWTVQSDEPISTAAITSKDVQHCVRFKRDDHTEIITNG